MGMPLLADVIADMQDVFTSNSIVIMQRSLRESEIFNKCFPHSLG